MPTTNPSKARTQLDDALRFSTTPNEVISALSVLTQLSSDQAEQLMRLVHTFMLLTTVGAFDAFLTERCREVRVHPVRDGQPVSPDSASFKEKLHALRATVPEATWKARVDDAHELYYKARTLWIHGAGLLTAVRDQPRDLSAFDQGSDGRCWVSERLWSGCVKALEGLAGDCL